MSLRQVSPVPDKDAAPGAIDMHAHLYSEVLGDLPMTAREYLHAMDAAGIEHSVIMTIDGFFRDAALENDRLVAWAGDSGGRLIPYCTVNPSAPGASAEIRRAVLELGCRGVKIHPMWQGVSPVDRRFTPVAQEAERLGVPILFHDGTAGFSSPLQIGWVAEQHPDLTVILGHGGLMDLWVEAVATVVRYPNCYICLCGSAPAAIFDTIIGQVPPDRILIGTDGGYGTGSFERVMYRMSVFRALDLEPAQREAIFRTNAARLLGLSLGQRLDS